MEKAMTPSSITSGQIGKICDLLTAGLRKAGLLSELVQTVIETQGEQLTGELIAVVRKRVDAVSDMIVRRSDMIVRRVTVDRNRNPQDALKATGRKQDADKSVVASMPRGEAEEVDVYFFWVSRYATDAELEEEYKVHGLKPADVYSLAAVNEEDPGFADKHPNATHWQDASERWCYAAFFRRWFDERRLYVGRRARDWSGGWWFAGLRK